MKTPALSQSLSNVFRQESGAVTASLIRILGSVDLAEDAVAQAFLVASERWPISGLPPNPGGWIATTARNRAIDMIRKQQSFDRRHRALQALPVGPADEHQALAEPTEALAGLSSFVEAVPDDQLRLLFLCCHPALSTNAQVALVLRLLSGFEVRAIARAFVTSEASIAQRITRAKRKLRDNNAGYSVPTSRDLGGRVVAVTTAIYLLYNEGHRVSFDRWSTGDKHTDGGDLRREAIRLSECLVELMPDELEAKGLLALELLTEARQPARLGPNGELVRLSDQDRSLWNREQIARGHALVRECLAANKPGPIQLQAAIAAVHTDAVNYSTTDWGQVVALYDQLLATRADPIVRLNRAVAVAELYGPRAGLKSLDSAGLFELSGYQPFHATRADLLARSGQTQLAIASYRAALELTTEEPERIFLQAQLEALGEGQSNHP